MSINEYETREDFDHEVFDNLRVKGSPLAPLAPCQFESGFQQERFGFLGG